jgi:hypothetical protein
VSLLAALEDKRRTSNKRRKKNGRERREPEKNEKGTKMDD